METPAPRVIAWNSDRTNAVGAEYIVMEKAQGIELESVWSTLDDKQKVKVVRSIAMHQMKWAEILFREIGSIYYTDGLQPSNNVRPLCIDKDSGEKGVDSKFTIGPIVGREWMDSGRLDLEVDRGPCRL